MKKLKALIEYFGGAKTFAPVAGVSWRTIYRWLNQESEPPEKLISLLYEKYIESDDDGGCCSEGESAVE